jgi:DNA-binding NtrC family response regulator
MARILYIEDDESIRNLTTRLLRREGHSVIEREDTDRADALVDQWSPHLVITDHELGKGKEEGLQLALRLHREGIKVVMLSGNSDAALKAAEARIPFFFKPCLISKLLKQVEL